MTSRLANISAGATGRSRDAALVFGVWAIGLTASLLNLLNFNNYPLFTTEVAFALAGALAAGMVMGGVHLLSQPRLSFLLTGLFAATIVGMNAPLENLHVFVLWAAVSTAAYFADKAVMKLIGAAFASVALFQGAALLGGGTGMPPAARAHTFAARAAAGERPAIVHIVLDSHLGLEGMRSDPESFGDLHASHLEFFARHGFQAFDGAYSRHVKTLNSLPYAFSYGRAPMPTTSQYKQYVAPGRLQYFSDLKERGYVASGLMPDFIDLCAAQGFSRCEMFMRSDLSSMIGTEMSAASKAKTFAFALLTLSRVTVAAGEFGHTVMRDFVGSEGRRIPNRTKLFPLTSVRALDEFTHNLSSLNHGELRYAHLLLPHDPYVFGADCTLKPEPEWLDEHGPGDLDLRDRAYADQVLCTLKRLDELMAVLNSTPAGRGAIVIVHGDHGSRVVDELPLAGAPGNARTETMSYSTQFVIRVPGEVSAIVPGRFALDELLADFAERDFSAAPRPAKNPAWILPMNAEWTPQAPVNLRPYSPPHARRAPKTPDSQVHAAQM